MGAEHPIFGRPEAPTVRQKIESKHFRAMHRAEKRSQFQMISRALSDSSVWMALCQHPRPMMLFWCLVHVYQQNLGDQSGGLVCSRRFFEKWAGSRDGDGIGEAASILVQLGLVDIVDDGCTAGNPRFRRPRKYALTIEPRGDKERTNRWQTDECQSYARVLLAAKREVGHRRVAAARRAAGLPPSNVVPFDKGRTGGVR